MKWVKAFFNFLLVLRAKQCEFSKNEGCLFKKFCLSNMFYLLTFEVLLLLFEEEWRMEVFLKGNKTKYFCKWNFMFDLIN